jgi:hypothetical protein
MSASIFFGSRARVPSEPKKGARKRRAPPAVRPPTDHASERGATAAVKEHLDARTASTGRHAERASAALPQRRQHALDVLARPKAIGSMVEAATGIGEAVEAADFHLVDATATGAYAERAENQLLRLDWLDSEDLGSAAPAAQRDFVFVGGPPTLQRGRSSTARALRRARDDVLPLPCAAGSESEDRSMAKPCGHDHSASIGRPSSRSISTRELRGHPASPFRSFLLTMLPIRFGPHSNMYASAHTAIWAR